MAVIITSPELLDGLRDRMSRQPAKRVVYLDGITTIQLVRSRNNTVACRVISEQVGRAENFDGEVFEFSESVVIYDLTQTQQLLSLKVNDEDTVSIIDGTPSVVETVVNDSPTKKKPVKK